MSTYTSSLGLEKITPGTQAGLWGNTTNNTYDLIDQAITGIAQKSFAGASGTTWTLTDLNGAEDEARCAVLNVTGTASGSNTIVIPNKQKTYFVRNSTGQDIVVQTVVGTTPCTVGAGYNLPVFCDGNNNVYLAILAPGAGTLTVSGGGTGKTTFNAGGFIKSPGGTADLTASATINAATELSGVVSVANGGTGKATLASGALLFGNGTGAVGEFVGGTIGYVPTWNGSAWTSSAPPGGVSSVSAGTGISISGTSTNPIVNNSGVLSVSAGSGVTITGTSANPIISASSSGGTVTSVGLSLPPQFSISAPNPVTTSGTLTASWTSQAANYVLAGPNGTSGSPTFRALVAADLPATAVTTDTVQTISGNKTMSGSLTISGSIQSSAYNFNSTSSWYLLGSEITGAISSSVVVKLTSSGGYNLTGTWGTISDVNQKENIQPARDYLEDINKVNVVKYSLKQEQSSVPTMLGVIAQELEQIFPGMIHETEDGIKNVKLSVFIPMLIKSVQELTSKLELAEARIAALEAK